MSISSEIDGRILDLLHPERHSDTAQVLELLLKDCRIEDCPEENIKIAKMRLGHLFAIEAESEIQYTGTGIRSLREDMKLSQMEFGSKIGVSHVTVNRWENNHFTPSPSNCKKIRKIEDQFHGDNK